MHWWKGAAIYQIYPRSFMDSNHDGIGDLKGITEKLSYIATLNVDAIWVSPFFLSPMKDFGYDVQDYRQVDPMFGHLDDFKAMLKEAHRLELKVIIDQVISHTSDQHPWFKQSKSSRNNDKSDWFVWSDAKPDGTPPNNWQSVFGGSAWKWESKRAQYYLHNFLESQPDLNYHHPEVRQQMLDEMRFWLDIGVDGFRLDTVNYYFHDKQLRDNPPMDKRPEKLVNPYDSQAHLYDKNRPESVEFTKQMREMLNDYDERMLLGEIGDSQGEKLMAQYTGPDKLNTAYSFALLRDEVEPKQFAEIINLHENLLDKGWPTWAFSNHDVQRVASRWPFSPNQEENAKLLLALLISLRGNICLYQGEELGLPEAEIPYELLQDPWGINFWPEFKGRDGCRTPMPWKNDLGTAGFGSDKPWLPIPETHLMHSVSEQESECNSVLNTTRKLIRFRQKHQAIKLGDISTVNEEKGVLWFTRIYESEEIHCIFNFSNETRNLPCQVKGQAWDVTMDSPKPCVGEKMLPACSWLFIETNTSET